MIIAVIILVTGIEFLQVSFERILNPEAVTFNVLQIVLLIVFLVAKLFIARLNIIIGKKTYSASLEASGTEAMADVLISAITIIGAVVSFFTEFTVDGYIGLLLSLSNDAVKPLTSVMEI